MWPIVLIKIGQSGASSYILSKRAPRRRLRIRAPLRLYWWDRSDISILLHLETVVRSGGRASLSTLIHLQPHDRTPMKSSKSNTKIPVATNIFLGIPGQHVPDSIGLKKEEAGLRCGGRGKSEISSALRMCSNEQYIRKLYAKLYFFLLIWIKNYSTLSNTISQDTSGFCLHGFIAGERFEPATTLGIRSAATIFTPLVCLVFLLTTAPQPRKLVLHACFLKG